jgi:Asp-tRNA(Asn)/Glu-tRNA(Gln) amidotransferase A subunit family amidase
VSCDGVVPVAPSLDTVGPIAGCVADLAVLLNAISSWRTVDPIGDKIQEVRIDLADLKLESLKPPRLALLSSSWEYPRRLPDRPDVFVHETYDYFERLSDASMYSALTRSVAAFRSAGASIVERDPGFFFASSHRAIMAYELANSHRDRIHKLRFDYHKSVAGLIEEGILTKDIEYEKARRDQERAIAESETLMNDVDALICPAARGVAPDPSTTGDPEFNSRWTYTGQPTITIPMDLSPEGLPVGIQLIGRRFDEVGVFRAAAWCEAVLPRLVPPHVPEKPAG